MSIMSGKHYPSEKLEQNLKYVQTDETVLHLLFYQTIDMKMSTCTIHINTQYGQIPDDVSGVCPYCQHGLHMTGLDAKN